MPRTRGQCARDDFDVLTGACLNMLTCMDEEQIAALDRTGAHPDAIASKREELAAVAGVYAALKDLLETADPTERLTAAQEVILRQQALIDFLRKHYENMYEINRDVIALAKQQLAMLENYEQAAQSDR